MATTTPTEWKTPFKVNTTDFDTSGLVNDQSASHVVALTGGRFVVVWLDYTDPLMLGAPDIFGQIFDALGTPIGNELKLLNAFVDYAQGPPQVAALSDGGFVLTYQTTADPLFAAGENIVAERFDAQGAPVGFSAQIAVEAADETEPAIVSFSNGSYAVVYADNDGGTNQIKGTIVDTTGTVGGEFAISAGAQAAAPGAALLANGNFVVVYAQESGGGEIAFSIRDATGAEVVSDVVDSAEVAGASPDVAGLSGGGFVVVWRDANGDGAGMPGIMARRYDASGVAAGEAVSVNTTTLGDQTSPSVAALADGGYAIVWDDDGGDVLRALRFGADGQAIGSEFVVASMGAEYEPSFAILGDGRIVVSFTSDTGGNPDVYAGIWDPRTSPVVGTSANDVLTGRLEGGTISGEAGADTLYGSANADVLVGGAGADQMIGGAGSDTADYSSSTGPVTVSLASGNGWFGDAQGDMLSGIENVTGSGFDDRLKGSGGGNRIAGGDGDDYIDGLGGNDVLIGGAGADQLVGGAGFDTADYSASALRVSVDLASGTGAGGDAQGDVLSQIEAVVGSAFDDSLSGGSLADRLNGGSGDDILDGQDGDDVLIGEAGADQLIGGAGVDTADYSASTSRVTISLTSGTGWYGHADGDTLSGIENVIGSSFDDSMKGDSRANRLDGGGGADTLDGQGGDDVLVGGAGADRLLGGAGIDTADYSASNGRVTVSLMSGSGWAGHAAGDTLIDLENVVGSAVGDTLKGSTGHNRLSGGAGDDTLDGQNGNDVLIGGAGNDRMVGGGGSDVFVFGDGVGNDTITDFVAGAGTLDAIDLSANSLLNGFADVLTHSSQSGLDTLIDLGGGDLLTLLGVTRTNLHQDDFVF